MGRLWFIRSGNFSDLALPWQDGRHYSQYPEGYFYFILLQKNRKDKQNMKTTIRSTILVILSLACVLCLIACNTVDASGLWENATYRKDMSFGNGAKTVVVEVKVEDQIITFTIKTDKDTVGAALLEHELIAGETSEYGLYVKVVNGITADYDVDQSYWAFYIDGEYAMSGVDTTNITEGAKYQLAYTK